MAGAIVSGQRAQRPYGRGPDGRGPAEGGARVALLHVDWMPSSYFFDTFVVALAGALERRGHTARVFAHNAHGLPSSRALTPLAEALGEFGPDVLLFDRLPQPRLASELRAALGTLEPGATARAGSSDGPQRLPGAQPVAVGVLFERVEAPEVDFSLMAPSARALDEAVRAAVAEARSNAAAEADAEPPREASGAAAADGTAPPQPLSVATLLGHAGALDYGLLTVVRPPPQAGPLRKHLIGNQGCPYRTARNRTGFLEGAALPPGVTAAGCTFCDRPAYEPLTRAATLDVLGHQLDGVLGAYPDVDELVLVDEHGLRYLEGFVERFGARLARTVGHDGQPAPPRELLLSTRVDWLLQALPQLEGLLGRLPAGLRLVAYLLGVENFSPMELARFNKGISPRQIGQALTALERLSRDHEGLRVESSFGFILLTPWTTPTDLALNLAYLRRFDVDAWRDQIGATRLRLYRDTALYYAALRDGLLEPAERVEGDDDVGFGYEHAERWRFQDERVGPMARALAACRDNREALATLETHLGPYAAEIRATLAAIDFDDPASVRRAARRPPAGP